MGAGGPASPAAIGTGHGKLEGSGASSMRAAVLDGFGQLSLREVAEPAVVAPTDVIVKVAAAGVCRTDLETIEGGLAAVFGPPEFPYVVGHETAGWIHQIGPDVQGVQVGDPVLLHPLITCGRCEGCRAGLDTYCANSSFPGVDAKTWGGFAEYMRTSSRAVVPVPKDSDLVALAPYSDAGITAYHAVKRVLPMLGPGSTVVVLGVGGVGHFALQLFRSMTVATVVAVDSSAERVAMARELGAHQALTGEAGDCVADALAMSGGGVDVVMDCAGGQTTSAAALAMLRKGGTLSVVGAGGELTAATLDLTVRELTVIANLIGSYCELGELVQLSTQGLRSVHRPYPLEDAAEAVEDLRAGRLDGRAVLIPAHERG